jgi:hypothetical protein
VWGPIEHRLEFNVPVFKGYKAPLHGGLSVVFLGCAGLAAIWLAFADTMRSRSRQTMTEQILWLGFFARHKKTPSREGQGLALL